MPIKNIKDKKRFGCPYKDSRPIETTNKIRNILSELGIVTIESKWFNPNSDKLSSCRVVIQGTEIGTNGKGITPEYALASAYAEFMERLQNLALLRVCELKKSIARNFFDNSNEKHFSKEDMPDLPDDFANAVDLSGQKLQDVYEELKESNNSSEFIPFYDVANDKIHYLHYGLILQVYTSNGMCAGNSPEEAISQGISELLERYTLKQICFNELTPPTIPEDYLKKNAPKQYALIKYIENSCKCKIIVKDCSLNKGIPSIAIGIVFQDKNVFHGHMGVDSIWQIALERCLTETFQGRDIIKNDISNNFKLACEEDVIENYRRLRHNGAGVFPLSFFDDQFSYPFKGFSDFKINSQKEKLTYLLKIIKNLECSNIYIRDVSFLGFPSYRVIIPGISETHNYQKVSYNLFNIANLSNNELETLAKNIELTVKNKKITNLSEYYNDLPATDNSPWCNITLDFFLSLIYYKHGEYSKAQDKLVDYVNYVKEVDVNSSVDYNYHCVAIQFLGLMSRYPDNFDKIKKILLPMFDENIVNEVLEDFSDKDNVFKYIPLPNNFDCDSCQAKQFCNYDKIEKIYLTVKEKSNQNPIDQMRLKEIFKQN